jgi:multidrug efflux pump subunit AcrB
MLNKFVSYRLKNTKTTWIMLGIIIVVGAMAWFIIPKQYNPDIVVPAFQITIPAP